LDAHNTEIYKIFTDDYDIRCPVMAINQMTLCEKGVKFKNNAEIISPLL
jgi:hypothetical protein